jgi:hypothetical protein
MPMWCSWPATRRVTTPELSILSWRSRSWVSRSRLVPAVAGLVFRPGLVGGGRGAALRQGAVGSGGVVEGDEPLEQRLQGGQVGGLGGLGAQPVLHGLLEAFDLAAGGGVVGSGVLLHDVESAQLVLQGVAAALAAGKTGGEHHPVVGQGRGRCAVCGDRGAEGGEHDRAGDSGVRADPQRVAGVVLEPGEDLAARAGAPVGVGEPVVGEVCLPALVGLVCLEPDVGGLGRFEGSGVMAPARTRIRLIVARDSLT